MGVALRLELCQQLLLILPLLSLVGGEALEVLLDDLLLMHHAAESCVPVVPVITRHTRSKRSQVFVRTGEAPGLRRVGAGRMVTPTRPRTQRSTRRYRTRKVG
jgi:hypothetical protein